MGKISSLDEFELYQIALDLTVRVYKLAKILEKLREYSLADQLKRASVSIPANIAEGFGKSTKKDFARFLSISLGSCNEVLTYLDLIVKLEFASESIISKLKADYLSLTKRLFSFRKHLSPSKY